MSSRLQQVLTHNVLKHICMCSLVCTNAVHMYSRCTLFSVTASRANCTIALTTRSSCAESDPCMVWSGWAVYVPSAYVYGKP